MNQFNNNFNGMPYYAQYNPTGITTPNQPPMNGILSAEEDKKLRTMMTGTPQTFFKATDEATELKGACDHKGYNKYLLEDLGNNVMRCHRCGETFTMMDHEQEQVEAIANKFLDVIQTIKTMYDGTSQELRNIYVPAYNIAKQLPNMYRVAQQCWDNRTRQQESVYSNNYYTPDMMYRNITGGAGIPGMDNDYQMMPQQPMNFGQPQQMMNFGQPQQPMNFGQPMGYQPQQMMPQQPMNFGQPQQMMPQQPMGYGQPQQINYAPAVASQPVNNYTAAANPIGNTAVATPMTAPAAPAAPTTTNNVVPNGQPQPAVFKA
jgi:hypothetical protein